MSFKVEKDGWYQCRNPEWVAHVAVNPCAIDWNPVGLLFCADEDVIYSHLWKKNGRYSEYHENPRDLISYLGTERPKQKTEADKLEERQKVSVTAQELLEITQTVKQSEKEKREEESNRLKSQAEMLVDRFKEQLAEAAKRMSNTYTVPPPLMPPTDDLQAGTSITAGGIKVLVTSNYVTDFFSFTSGTVRTITFSWGEIEE